MGADGGMPGSASRGNVISSSDLPTILQYLSLEPISLGTQKYMRSGELRRALGFPLVSASEDHMFRVSSFKPAAPIATEDLKQFKDNVLNASFKARERSKVFRNSIHKLEKYIEATGSKKRQRTELLSTERPGVSGFLKTAGQPPRNPLDQSAQRLEDRAKSAGMNKRFRSSAAEFRVDSKSGSLTKDQMSDPKDSNIPKAVGGASAQPEERILRLPAVGEGWDKNMKRKRSVGTVANRSADNDMRKAMQTKLSTDTKLASCDNSGPRLNGRSNAKQDTSSGSAGTNVKGKFSRAPRTGSLMAVNSSDGRAVSESCEGWGQPSSTSKVISIGLVQNNHRAANSSHMLGQWVGQRQQKSSRSRRTNVVSPVTNHDEGQIVSLNSAAPISSVRSPLNENSGAFDSGVLVHNINSTTNTKIKVVNTPSPGRLSEVEDILGIGNGLEDKGKDSSEVQCNGKGKVHAFVVPTKRNKNFPNENGVDGMRKHGRTVRGLSLSKSGVESEVKLENMSTIKRVQNSRHGSEKIRGKTGRPPSKKMSDGKVTRNLESDDDHEELVAAAASARKASYLSCSGRLWKKMEPVFGSVSLQDGSYLKQQLTFAEELEDSHSLISCTENNFLDVFVDKGQANVPFGRKGSNSNQVDENAAVPTGLCGERNLEKFSSLYQRVLSALIEEDENDRIYNGYEGVSMSFQCASDDSHCGSSNYADAETRDRDRFESEAESIVDFHTQKRYPGDGFSCNKSVTSNATWNTSMSDSLYSSGRWLGDDGLSYSDAEFIDGSCQNDLGGPQDLTATGAFFDCQYQLMCVDDKLIMELQSIGLFPDAMPDLADGEVINRDITELKEGLYDQIGKKKHNLVKIDSAVQDDCRRNKRFMEQIAMEQLIQMAYKRRMAYRRNNASKTVMRKVSKQVAVGFIERTLARFKAFEATGRSCFSEPALQNVIFAASQGTEVGSNGAPKQLRIAKAGCVSLSIPDSCVNDFSKGCTESPQAARHSFDISLGKLESIPPKVKKRELLLDDVGGAYSSGATTYGSSLIGGANRKTSESDRDKSKGSTMTNTVRKNLSVAGFKSEEKPRAKNKQKSSGTHPPSSSVQEQNAGNHKMSREMFLSSSCSDPKDVCENSEEPIDFDSMAQNDTSAPDDLNDWFKDLPDGDFAGLDIPMDDLSMVF